MKANCCSRPILQAPLVTSVMPKIKLTSVKEILVVNGTKFITYTQGSHNVLISKICPFFEGLCLRNYFVLISKKCPYFDLCPYFCFILGLEVFIPGTSIGQFE